MTESSAQSYQGLRPYLFAVAYRFTGSATDAEDLVHDAWMRYLAAGSPIVDSLRAYLTTIVSRLALDHLKSARVRRVDYVGEWLPEPLVTPNDDPAHVLEERADLSMALLTLLDTLTPDQRIVYVLRESLALPFDEIGRHLGRSPATCRQLYRRARQRLEDTKPSSGSVAPDVTARFLTALETGDAAALTDLLAEDVVWISDAGPHRLATRNPIVGRDRVVRGLVGVVGKFFPDPTFTLSLVQMNHGPAILIQDETCLDTVIQWNLAVTGITHLWYSRNPEKLRFAAEQLGLQVWPLVPGKGQQTPGDAP